MQAVLILLDSYNDQVYCKRRNSWKSSSRILGNDALSVLCLELSYGNHVIYAKLIIN